MNKTKKAGSASANLKLLSREATPEMIEAGLTTSSRFGARAMAAIWSTMYAAAADLGRNSRSPAKAEQNEKETPSSLPLRAAVAIAIERADRKKSPDGYADGVTGKPVIDHDEVSDWSVWLADAALGAMPDLPTLDRVEIARIVDPTAWQCDSDGFLVEQVHSDAALATADAIIAYFKRIGGTA